jgi:hypothetical protein
VWERGGGERLSITKLHLFQFADEMSNSHIYKFSQNNLYSYNIYRPVFYKMPILCNDVIPKIGYDATSFCRK